jgi:hypothetical protein
MVWRFAQETFKAASGADARSRDGCVKVQVCGTVDCTSQFKSFQREWSWSSILQ